MLVISGQYQEIVPPSRLAFTWHWAGAPVDEPITLVTVTFQAHPLGTELTLTHERFGAAASRDQHEAGWLGCLDHLARLLAADVTVTPN